MATQQLSRLSQRRFVDAIFPWQQRELSGYMLEYVSLDNVVNGNDVGRVLVDYLIHGFEPGSFYYSVFSNNMFAAVQHAHPAISIGNLKPLVGFMREHFPEGVAWGNQTAVNRWLDMFDDQRFAILCERGLWLTEAQEIWAGLQGIEYSTPVINWRQILEVQ
jgi:hypothetical protein